MSIGDYDPSDVEHHKVVNTIFSLVKRLLRLTGPDLTKDFLMQYQNTATSNKPFQDRRRNEYDDSGSSDKEYAKNDGLSDDYFPAAASSRSQAAKFQATVQPQQKFQNQVSPIR